MSEPTSAEKPSVAEEFLEFLVCPKSRGELTLVELPEEVRSALRDRYREHFQDEEPVVEQAFLCAESSLVYPIVSGIPIMLVDEALSSAVLE